MRRVTLILPALLLALGLTLGLAGRAAAAPGLTGIGTPGDSSGPVSCWSAGNCIVTVLGDGTSSSSILLIRNGAVAGRERVPTPDPGDFIAIYDASCPTATICFLSGVLSSDRTAHTVGFVAPVVGDTLGALLTFSQVNEVDAISCAADGDCLAVGGRDGAGVRNAHGSLIALSDGVVERISGLGAIDPAAMSCSGNACLVVGDRPNRAIGASVVVTDGVPGKVVTPAFQPGAVACTGPSTCLVVGAVADAHPDNAAQEYVATVHNGHYGTAQALPVYVNQLACTTASTCFGTTDTFGTRRRPGRGGTIAFTNGIPGRPRMVPGVSMLLDLGCAGGSCLADGTSTPGNRGVIDTF